RILFKSGSRSRRLSVGVSRTVLLLGLTSLLTDVSAEMVSTVLPLYVFFTFGAAPLVVSLIDGIYQGATALLQIFGGVLADRFNKHKDVASVGYGISAVCKLGLAIGAGAVGAVAALVVIDRAGKGLRTGPRDAMISLSTEPAELGSAFGVHRALDTAGAMLGPLIAFGMLLLEPGQFSGIFMVSFCFAMLGLAVIVLLVKPVSRLASGQTKRVSVRATAEVLRAEPFRRLVIAGTLLNLATISDALFYLGLQRKLDFQVSIFPLLFVGTSLVYMLLAVPVGRLADRIGRMPVLVGGYLMLVPVYLALLVTSLPIVGLAGCLIALGTWYAASDGVLAAFASSRLDEDVRTTGLSVVGAATGLAGLGSSLLFGLLWTVSGITLAALTFVGLLIAAALASVMLLRADERHAVAEH
ncbi:MAG TPA: MFS transporter, partial [Solirubrobacteraceae bacterium]